MNLHEKRGSCAPVSVVSQSRIPSASTSETSFPADTAEKALAPPEKSGTRLQRLIRHRLLIIYRRLFSFVFVCNVAALVAFLVPPTWPTLSNLGLAVSVNLFFAVLIRQEHVVNFLFACFCSVPLAAPLWLRKLAAHVYHIGGLHSGCAVAAFVWFVVFTVAITRQFLTSAQQREIIRDPAVLVVTYLILVVNVVIIVLAFPRFRARYHNSFEAVHRFGGWSVLILLWIQLVLLADSSRKLVPGLSLAQAVCTNPSFWLLLAASCSIILPWLCLRHVPVQAEVLSHHALRLNFSYTTSGVGSAVRITDRPLTEWHAFAAFSVPGAPRGFSIVVSNAGDWTRRLIAQPPRRIWVRGVPTSGVLRVATLFRRVVLVATGSGIGPCLSVIYYARLPCRVLWSAPNPLATFGAEIVGAVRAADPHAVIHNTRTMGKPDMVALAYRLYVESDAEAVVVISNPALTKKVVYGMESRGVPAYGPIWDS